MQLVLLELFNFFAFFFPAGFPYFNTYSASKHALHVRIRLVERFSYDLEMKTREQSRNNKRTEI